MDAGMSAQTQDDQGFTLLEMLLALAIGASLIVLMTQAVVHARKSWAAVSRSDDRMELIAAAARVGDWISDAMAIYAPDSQANMVLVFRGLPDSVELVAPVDRADLGGLYLTRVVASSTRTGLEIERTLFKGAHDAHAADSRTEHVRHISGVSFRYFGETAKGLGAAWHDEWSGTSRLPELVEARFWVDRQGRRIEHTRTLRLRLRPPTPN